MDRQTGLADEGLFSDEDEQMDTWAKVAWVIVIVMDLFVFSVFAYILHGVIHWL